MDFLVSSKFGEFWACFYVKIPLHRLKFGKNLLVKEMLTQNMWKKLTLSQNKSKLLG
jgi:hypothetical protein